MVTSLLHPCVPSLDKRPVSPGSFEEPGGGGTQPVGPPQSLGERLGVLPRAHFGMIPMAIVLEEHAGVTEVKVRGT